MRRIKWRFNFNNKSRANTLGQICEVLLQEELTLERRNELQVEDDKESTERPKQLGRKI